MIETEETAFEFFIPHEQFAKAIEPAMRDLHHPAPGALRGMPPLLVGFLPTSFDVGNVAMFFNDAERRGTGIASIGAQVLAASLRWRGTLHRDGIKDHGDLADIMSICPGHDDRQRDATTVHQQMALAPIFFPDPSGLARRLPEPVALSSSLRRCSAIATQCLPSRRTPPTQLSTGLQTRQPSATPESACELRSRYQSVRPAAPSTDTPCATRTQSPRTPRADPSACVRRQVCAQTSASATAPPVAGSTVRRAPRMHRKLPMTPVLPSPLRSSVAHTGGYGRKVYSFIYG